MSGLQRATLVALLAVSVSAIATADTITTLFFDDFESDIGNTLDAELINWNIYGSIDILHPALECATAGNASNCVDLDGTNPPGGAIETKSSIGVAPGTYRLMFDLAGSQRQSGGLSFNDTVTVSVGSYFLEDFTLGATDPFQALERDFLIGGDDFVLLRFDHQGADRVGLLLDNVRFAKVNFNSEREPGPASNPTEASEPPALLLLVSGLGVMAAWRIWRSHQQLS
jgi:hypothetical protein